MNGLVAFALRELGSLQALVLNAGIYGPMGPTESVSLDEWRRAMDINLFGVLLPCRAVIPHFKKAGRGKIIVLSGGGATNPLPNISAYAASKAAVVRLDGNSGGGIESIPGGRECHCAGRSGDAVGGEVLAAGPEKVGTAVFREEQEWKEKGAVPLELGARLAVYLASAESDGITGKLISAQWDPWEKLQEFKADLNSDIYTLRRIVPKDRGKKWGDK